MTGSPNSNYPYQELVAPDPNNETIIVYREISPDEYWPADFLYSQKRKYYKYLDEMNQGRKNGPKRYHYSYATYEAAEDLINILASQLGLTTRQQGHARDAFLDLDRGKMGQDLVLVAYSVCSYIVEDDDRNTERRCHPDVKEEDQDEVFKKVRDSLGLDKRAITKMYGKIEHRISTPYSPHEENNEN